MHSLLYSSGTLKRGVREALSVLSVLYVSLSSGIPRGVHQGKALSVLHVVCPLASREGYTRGRLCLSYMLSVLWHPEKGTPGEGLSVLHVVCPLVLREGHQGKACPSYL